MTPLVAILATLAAPASAGPRKFRDPSPSDRSRCDGVWRPIARCP